MKALAIRLTSDRVLTAVLLGFLAYVSATIAMQTDQPIWWAGTAICGAVGVGLLARQRWAELTAIGLLLAIVLGKVFRLINEGWSWKQALFAVGISMIAYGLWKNPDSGFFSNDEDDTPADAGGSEPMISLVHLRSSQRYLEPVVLAHALSDAWGIRIAGPDDDPEQADGFVAGDNPLFIVMVQKPSSAVFMVHNHDQSYFDEPGEVAGKVPNLRFAEVIRDHNAWLAVDLMRAGETALEEAAAYQMIGKAVAILADDDVMAIVYPQHNYFNLWSDDLESMLCGDEPLEALLKEVKAPVYGVPDGDLIENAITEARERWPEFVEVFQSRSPGDERFLVKARFEGDDGEVEHMWFQVFGLEPEYIHGHLINDPLHTSQLKNGSQVEVPVTDVSDWICPGPNDEPLGNFTHQAVVAAANATSEGP